MSTAGIPRAISTRISRWLALGHFTNDFFSGSLGILLAAQAARLGLSGTQIGMAAGIFAGVSLIQPALGWLTDRMERSYLMLLGAFVTALGIFCVALAGNFPLIFLGATLGGVGNAMFHPVALASSRAFAQQKSSGRSVALFMMGGNGGYAVGPLAVGILVDAAGLGSIAPLVVISGLLIPTITWRLRPYIRGDIAGAKPVQVVPDEQDIPETTAPAPRVRWYRTAGAMLVAYLLVVLLRSTMHQSLGTYLPVFYEQNDHSLTFAGIATGALLMAAAIGSYVGGWLSDFVSRRLILSLSLFSMTPLLLLLLRAETNIVIFGLSFALGFMLNANWPILLMIGQEVLPGQAVSASGFAFGWGFFSAAIASFFVGVLADEIGLFNALQLMAFMPLLALGLLGFLPPEGQTEPTDVPAPAGHHASDGEAVAAPGD